MASASNPTDDDSPPIRKRPGSAARAEQARRRRLRRDLAIAVEQDGLVLQYQPRRSLGTGQPTGQAALLQWPHPRRLAVPVATLAPLAAESGLVTTIGGWVLLTACREAIRWQLPWVVSVTVSPRQLSDGALLAQVAAALEGSGLDPERLVLEFAEATLLGIDADTLLILSAIRDLGAGIGLEDFGAGIGSLSMLKRLPLTTMKVDRSLVRDLPFDGEDVAIIRAVIDTAHVLGLTVVAEGLDNEPQRAFLSECGCDEGQGALFGRPVPAEALWAA